MGTFWRRFLPLQLWRFVWINLRMYLIASGRLGPSKHETHGHAPAKAPESHRPD
ncbi:MAG: hypothetical protein WAJ85_11950 [Candidatus Baltobacteraceae bacterium]|jgi:hypothetical protein